PEREPDRQAHLAIRDALARVPIELSNRDECSGTAGADSATNVGGWQAFVDDDRQVAHDRREAWQRRDGAHAAGRSPAQYVEFQFACVYGGVAGIAAREPADPSGTLSADEDVGRFAPRRPRQVGRW